MSPETGKQDESRATRNEPRFTGDKAQKHCVLIDAVRNLNALIKEGFYTKQSIQDVIAEDLHD